MGRKKWFKNSKNFSIKKWYKFGRKNYVKMAKISYCYFYSLVKLIEISNFHITNKQKKLVEHKIAVIKLKSLINSEYKKIILPTEYKFKLIFTKLLSDLIKKIYIKLIYKFIKN